MSKTSRGQFLYIARESVGGDRDQRNDGLTD